MLIHDAIDDMTRQADLQVAIGSATVHLRPGGLAIVVPDDETALPGAGG